MALWLDPGDPTPGSADTDILMFDEGQPQPPGRSIMRYGSWTTGPTLSAYNYDWSRIVAALIDEPYLLFMSASERNDHSNPCGAPGSRTNAINKTAQLLPPAAAALKSVAPFTRFWVNFNADTEVRWMMDAQCPLPFNQDYIDVISLDAYWRPFYTDPNSGLDYVQAYYDWIVAHRATPHQQLALIPGTFYQQGDVPLVQRIPSFQASYIQGYFDYANDANRSCNLSLGSRGVTGSFDGCPVWMVLGWLAGNYTDGSVTYIGELDPSSAPIASVWRQEVALPLRPGLAHQLSRAQIIGSLISQWQNN